MLDLYALILAFIFGTIVGSFLNVISLRFNTGMGINGRSKCMTCGKTLSWIELVPLFSFLFQRGSCRSCKSKISWQYPLVEFVAGGIFVLLFFAFPPTDLNAALMTFLQMLMACLLVVITVYDIKHKIIPNEFVYTFAFVALLSLFVGGATLWHIPTWTQLIAGPLLALPFAAIWLFSRGTWMGLGDAKLVLGIGWLLGVNAGANAIIIAFWIGAIASLGWIFYTYKKFKPRMEIPFGPYLILGLYIVLIFKVIVIDLHMLVGLFTV